MQQIAYFGSLLAARPSASVDVRQAWASELRERRRCGCSANRVATGFCVVKIFDLGEVYGVTLLVVTSSPGGSYSNWWCSLLNADLALSVAMTTASTILSLGLLPLNLIIWVRRPMVLEPIGICGGAAGSLHRRRIGGILLGLTAGVAFGSNEEPVGDSPRKQKSSKGAKARAFFNALGQLSGVALIAVAFLVSSRDEPVWDKHAGFYVAVALPCLVGLALSTVLAAAARLTKPARATVAVECAYQNPGIATVVALSMFDGNQASRAVGVPLYYGFIEAVFIGVYLVGMWKAGWLLAPPDASVHSVLLWNWQEKGREEVEDATEDPEGVVVDETPPPSFAV